MIDVSRPREGFDPEQVREQFPLLKRTQRGKPLVYLDSAATSQKPQSVIDALSDYYTRINANVHRGLYQVAEEATEAYEATRTRVAEWLGGVDRETVVFTRGTTESINLVAATWGKQSIGAGDVILLTRMEHHANLVPWQQLAKEAGASLEFVDLTEDGRLDMTSLREKLALKPVLFAFTHMSNVLGTINPAAEMVAVAHEAGCTVLIDGAQSVPHLPVDLVNLDADFYAFSAHKMLGPTGLGVLVGRRELLDGMPPYQTGGEMIRMVSWEEATWAELPHKFEAGTPPIAEVVSFNAALDLLDELGMEAIHAHEQELVDATFAAFAELGGVRIFGSLDSEVHGGVIAFEVEGVHPHDLSQLLDAEGIAIRAGHHCAQPLTRMLGQTSTARASFSVYNTLADVKALVDAIGKAQEYFAGNGLL